MYCTNKSNNTHFLAKIFDFDSLVAVLIMPKNWSFVTVSDCHLSPEESIFPFSGGGIDDAEQLVIGDGFRVQISDFRSPLKHPICVE